MLLVFSCQEKKTATALFEEGQKLFEEQKYDQAIVKYEEGLELSPHSAAGYNYLGMAYRFKYNAEKDISLREKEIEAFSKAIECDSTFWVAYVNLGATYYYSGRKKEAVPYLKRALELQPEHHEEEQILKMIEEGQDEEAPE
jgi:tetratricopeptide (TPR) repeat protein